MRRRVSSRLAYMLSVCALATPAPACISVFYEVCLVVPAPARISAFFVIRLAPKPPKKLLGKFSISYLLLDVFLVQ